MLRVAQDLRAAHPDLRVVLPHRDPRVHALISSQLQTAGADFVELHRGEIHPALARAQVVLAKSGTGSLESCLIGTPTVIVFRVRGWFHRFVAHNLLNVPWFASANLIAGCEVVPELALVREQDWHLATDRVEEMLRAGPTRDHCLAGLSEVRQRLGSGGACQRAAKSLLPFCTSGPR